MMTIGEALRKLAEKADKADGCEAAQADIEAWRDLKRKLVKLSEMCETKAQDVEDAVEMNDW